ncbi:family 1 glycosylhydrolase [Deinococcus aquiradiocola]|nr:family 1 glycosylhydrolase [Deinococcus aquiradiocola]
MAPRSFLAAMEAVNIGVNGSRTYAGDEFGGASGTRGDGLPTGTPGNFMFATGIECSYPMTRHGRRDQLRECGHYSHWEQDFDLVQGLGLKYLRYGLPYHEISTGPGTYDWEKADELMAGLRRRGITPILDLLHFGLPDWLGDFQNPELPVHFAAFAGEAARRYGWVRHFTPVNEIYVTARSSGRDGLWNERLKSERGFVTALKHAAAASILACHAIVRERPDAVIIQSESAEYLHDACAEPRADLALHNKMSCLSLDLLYAHVPDVDTYRHARTHGLSENEYQWFMAGEPPGHQIIGSDYYGRNERIVLPDRSELQAEDVLGWHTLASRLHRRYRRPVMHTETNTFDADRNPAWLWKQWMNVLQLRREGVPVVGFTWYSLTDQIDWDTGLAELNSRVNPVGLYDLQRQPRPVEAAYRDLLQNYGQITVVPHGEMFELTAQPATLRVQV